MFGNPYRQDKSDAGMSGGAGGGADEAWLEGPDGPVLRGPGKRRRSPSLGPQLLSAGDGDSIAAGKIASPADGVQPVALETAALVPPVGQNGARGGDEEAGEIVGAMEDGEHQVLEEEQSRSSAAASGQASMRHDQVVKPSGKLQAHADVVKFLLSILSAIKSRSSSREQIFELLEAPDFPVDKQNFVQQLVLQVARATTALSIFAPLVLTSRWFLHITTCSMMVVVFSWQVKLLVPLNLQGLMRVARCPCDSVVNALQKEAKSLWKPGPKQIHNRQGAIGTLQSIGGSLIPCAGEWQAI
eukprot:SM000344S13012  [mRNA]  locus=s344:92815:94405:- [translate_table: standard]